MKILPLHSDVKDCLRKKGLEKKFKKQIKLFKNDPFHPGLATELLEPKRMKIWMNSKISNM